MTKEKPPEEKINELNAENAGGEVVNLQKNISGSVSEIEDAIYFGDIEALNAQQIREEIVALIKTHEAGLPEVVVDDLVLGSTMQVRRGYTVTTGMVLSLIEWHQHNMSNNNDFVDSAVELLNQLDVGETKDPHIDTNISNVTDSYRKRSFKDTVPTGIHGDFSNKVSSLEWYCFYKINDMDEGSFSSVLRNIPTYQEYLVIDAVCLKNRMKKSGLTAQQYIDGMLTFDTENRRERIEVIVRDLRAKEQEGDVDVKYIEKAWEQIKSLIYDQKGKLSE